MTPNLATQKHVKTMSNGALSLIFIAPISDLEPSYSWLTSTISPGGFKSVGTKRAEKKKKAEVLPENVQGATKEATSVFSCPQDGCVKVFQRLSSLEKHLSLEKMHAILREEVFVRPC